MGSKSKYASEWEAVRKKKEEEEKANRTSNVSTSSSAGSKYASEWEAVRRDMFVSSLPDKLEELTNTRNELVNNYTSRFTDKDGNYIKAYRGDTKDALTSFETSKATLDKETKAMLDSLSKYEQHLNADDVKKIRDYLTTYSGDLSSMYDTYKSDHDYYSQWADEDTYNRDMKNRAYSQKYAKSTYADLQKAKTDIEKQLAKDKNNETLNDELSWLQNHDTDGIYVDSMSNADLQQLKQKHEDNKATLKNEKNALLQQKAKIEKKASRTDASSWNGYKEIVTRIEEIDKALAEESPVLYYDDNGVAETVDTVLTMRENEGVLANINKDEKIKSAYEKALAASEEVKRIDNLMAGAETSKLRELATEKNKHQAIIDEFEALGYDFESLKYYEGWKADRENFAETQAQNEKYAQMHPVAATAQSLISAPLTPFELADNLVKANRYGYSNVYDDHNINQNQTYQSAVSDMINTEVMKKTDNEILSWLASSAYSGVSSSAQSAMTIGACTLMFGPAGGNVALAIMGTEAAASSYNNAVMNGSTNEEAILTAVSSGIAEAAFEKLSLDNLIKVSKMYDVSSMSAFLKSLIKNSGASFVQGGVEASEEFLTEISNQIADGIINGDHSSYNTAIAKYKKMGYSDTDAREIATKDVINEIITAAYGGFIGGMGAGMGAGSVQGTRAAGNTVANEIVDRQYYNQMGKNIVTNEGVQDVVNKAKDIPALRRLAAQVEGVKTENLTSDKGVKKYEKQVGKLYKGVTRSQMQQLSKIKASETETESFKNIISEKLESAGVDNVDKVADIVVKKALGSEKLTREETALFNSINGEALIDTALKSEKLIVDEGGDFSKLKNNVDSVYNVAKFNKTNSIKRALLSETDYQISRDGKTSIRDSGDEVESFFITSVNDDDIEVNVKSEKGQKVMKASELTLSQDHAILFEGFKKIKSLIGLDESTGNKLLSLWETYDGDAFEFYKAVESGLMYGRYNLRDDFEKNEFAKTLSKDTRDIVFALGQEYGERTKKDFVESMDTPEKAKAASELYKREFGHSSDFKTAFNIYYDAGLKGKDSFSKVDKNNTFAHSYPKEWRESVFNAGRRNRVYKPGINKLYKTSEHDLSENQKRQLKILDMLGKKYGISFLVFDKLYDNGSEINGMQIAGTNKVAVSLDSDGKLYLRTAGHECFHVIEEWNPEAAAELTDKVINYLKQTEDYNYDVQVKRYAKTYGLDASTSEGLFLIHSEMAADSMFDVFSNEKFIKDIVTENRTLAQKIKDFLIDLVSELRKMISHFNKSEEMNALRNQTAALEDINASFISALETATKNMQETLSDETKNTAESGALRKSIRLTKDDLADYLNAGERKNKMKLSAIQNNQKIILTSESEIKGYINDSIKKETTGVTVAYGKVNERLSNDVKFYSKGKINVEGNFLEIVPYDMQHAYEEHHIAKEEGDIDLELSDFENLPEYLDNYDELLYAITYASGKTRICVSKVLPNGRILIIETVSKSRGALQFKNAIGVSEEKYKREYLSTYKKRSSENSRGNRSSNISLRDSSTSNNSKPQNATIVNNNYTHNNSDNTQNRNSIKLTQKSQQVLDENPELKNVLQDLQNELSLTKGYVPEGKVIHKYAVQLKKDNSCSMNVAEIERDLREIYSVLSSMSGSEGYEYAADLTLSLAKRMLDSSRVLDDLNAEKKELRQKLTSVLKGHKWYLSPQMRSEIEYHYDSYGNFHKKLFGKGFSFSENSTDYLDSDWSELCAAVPELLDSDTPAAEQPLAILEAFSATEYDYGLFDEYQYDSQAKYIATDIMDNLAAVPEADTMIGKIKASEYDRIAQLKRDNAEKIKELKKKYTEDIERTAREEKTHYKLQIKRKLESEKAAKARKSIETTMVRLSGMLANGKKNRHIPLKFIDTVRELCYSITLNRASQAKLGDNLNKIEALYTALNQGKDGLDGETSDQFLKNAYDEYVHNLIHNLNEQLKHKSIGDMTLEELILVDGTVKAIAQRVARANELHIESKNEGVEETVQAIFEELGAPKIRRDFKYKSLNKISDDFDFEKWNFLKPAYAWRMMGSDTFSDLMNNIRKGEDVLGVDISEAREKFLEMSEKYNKSQWENESKQIKFDSGETFTLSVQQLMMLYAASQREQFVPHLIGHKRGEKSTVKGGFVFEDAYKAISENPKNDKKGMFREFDANTHHLTENDLDSIANILTSEQKAYANEMRDYLANDCAVKGNEITRQLYDMNKFVEDKYFPIKVAKEYLDSNLKDADVKSVLGSTVMKDLQEGANNPVILREFDDVWDEHVQQMAMFHSFALPLDDFSRVFNWKSNTGKVSSMISKIETACGKGAVRYIENFIKDVNGGIKSQSSGTWITKSISLFKKTAVAASASVVVQQPTAIVRAWAMIDPKYFVHGTDGLKHKEAWEELKKHAPIAIIKEMGGFDVGGGKQNSEYIKAKEYKGIKSKAKGLLTDSVYRDEMLMRGASVADEIGWISIWNAVKNEITKTTTHKVGSDEFFKACSERFTDIITYTQVYDSVFSRSGFMRNKGEIAKMATSFMGEPTTSFNMLFDAVMQLARGEISWKKSTRIIGATMTSVILAAVAKSFIYALRDDDEDESYAEKYAQALTNSLSEDIWIHNMLPFVSDITSLLSGWDVERTDMAIFKDIWDAINDIDSPSKSTYRKIEDLVGAFAALFGFPAKNLMRTGREMYNAVANILDNNTADIEEFGTAAWEGLEESFYNSFIVEKITGGYKGGNSTSDVNVLLDKGKNDKAKELIDEIVSEKIEDGKTENEARSFVKSSVTGYWKERYLQAYRDKDDEEMLRIRKLLKATGLYDDVVKTCSDWVKSMSADAKENFKKW